jgi:hypothetical protein
VAGGNVSGFVAQYAQKMQRILKFQQQSGINENVSVSYGESVNDVGIYDVHLRRLRPQTGDFEDGFQHFREKFLDFRIPDDGKICARKIDRRYE